jgi:dolichyl-phosphate beta-glucosyltransferase
MHYNLGSMATKFDHAADAEQPFLSVIIPAYNEEQRLPPTLQIVTEFLRGQAYTAEVLVVENGSTDHTSEVVEHFCRTRIRTGDPIRVHLLHSAKGKGAAVKHGMLNARGAYCVMSDADLAVPISEVTKFLPPARKPHSFDIAIASREGKGAVRYGEPFHRHFMGRVFNFLVRRMAVPGVQDTQCGFKCFTREAARFLFPLQRIDGWGFDVEILHIATRYKMRIVEVPVHWYYGQNSRIRPIENTISMVNELIHIRMNGRRGFYDVPALQPGANKLPTA